MRVSCLKRRGRHKALPLRERSVLLFLWFAEILGAFDTDGELVASFGAPRFQDIAPAFAPHLFSKAVHAQAVQALGLIWAFQSNNSFRNYPSPPPLSLTHHHATSQGMSVFVNGVMMRHHGERAEGYERLLNSKLVAKKCARFDLTRARSILDVDPCKVLLDASAQRQT